MASSNFKGIVFWLSRFVAAALVGSLVTAVAVYIYLLDSRPDLSVWHLADLDEEFTTDSEVADFRQYLDLEDLLQLLHLQYYCIVYLIIKR